MSYRTPPGPVWVLLGTLLWLAAMLGTIFIWAMFAGVAYRPPVADIGAAIICGVFILTYAIITALIVFANRDR